jgi:hypothetical protein
MAEALVDEIDHPDTGLVSRAFLRAELQTLRADLIGTVWRVVLMVFGIQVVLVGVSVAILIEMLGKGAWRERAGAIDDASLRAAASRREMRSWREWCSPKGSRSSPAARARSSSR